MGEIESDPHPSYVLAARACKENEKNNWQFKGELVQCTTVQE